MPLSGRARGRKRLPFLGGNTTYRLRQEVEPTSRVPQNRNARERLQGPGIRHPAELSWTRGYSVASISISGWRRRKPSLSGSLCI